MCKGGANFDPPSLSSGRANKPQPIRTLKRSLPYKVTEKSKTVWATPRSIQPITGREKHDRIFKWIQRHMLQGEICKTKWRTFFKSLMTTDITIRVCKNNFILFINGIIFLENSNVKIIFIIIVLKIIFINYVFAEFFVFNLSLHFKLFYSILYMLFI